MRELDEKKLSNLMHIFQTLGMNSCGSLGHEFLLKVIDKEKVHSSPAGTEIGEKAKVLFEAHASKIPQKICN